MYWEPYTGAGFCDGQTRRRGSDNASNVTEKVPFFSTVAVLESKVFSKVAC
jgi:hypothetical protein